VETASGVHWAAFNLSYIKTHTMSVIDTPAVELADDRSQW